MEVSLGISFATPRVYGPNTLLRCHSRSTSWSHIDHGAMSSFISRGPVTVMGTVLSTQASDTMKSLDIPHHEVPALPSCFPQTLEGELAWHGADFVSESTFIYELTETDKNEITAGLAHFKGK